MLRNVRRLTGSYKVHQAHYTHHILRLILKHFRHRASAHAPPPPLNLAEQPSYCYARRNSVSGPRLLRHSTHALPQPCYRHGFTSYLPHFPANAHQPARCAVSGRTLPPYLPSLPAAFCLLATFSARAARDGSIYLLPAIPLLPFFVTTWAGQKGAVVVDGKMAANSTAF